VDLGGTSGVALELQDCPAAISLHVPQGCTVNGVAQQEDPKALGAHGRAARVKTRSLRC
jgi:hypothetical protein